MRRKIPPHPRSIALCFALASFLAAGAPSSQSSAETGNSSVHSPTEWFEPEGTPVGVALVLPGLNLKPERMDTLARALADDGILVLRGCLTGHSGGRELLEAVTAETWISDCLSLYDSVSERSKRYGVPVFFVGHSLGCLAILDTMERFEGVKFDRLVLFAPAITPRGFTRSIRLIGKKRIIPSKTPEEYRVHDGLPASAYRALLKLAQHLRASCYRRIDVPSIVFIDRRDELVCYRSLLDLTKTRLTRWRVVAVSNDGSALLHTFHHLIVDEESAGSEQWRTIRGEISAFLR